MKVRLGAFEMVKFSIIIPAFSEAKYIDKALRK